MKKIVRVFIVFAVICTVILTGCGQSINCKELLPGEWFVWHWYYEGGDDGFFDNAVFYTFSEDGRITIKENTEDAVVTEATYVWENDNTIIVSYPDGTSDTIEIAVTEYDGKEQLKYINVDTGYILSMEHMADWTE